MSGTWQYARLGDVCQTGAGGTPLSSKKEYYEGGTIPWLVSGEVAQGQITSSANFITKLGLENSSARIFPENTVLVAMYGATAGQVGILRFRAATNQAVCGILPNNRFVPEFLYYLLLSKKKRELIAQAAGNAQPNISQIKIKNTTIPIPPLSAQQRLVAILDEAFAGLATATANVTKNFKDARELFDSYLNAIFTQTESWSTSPIGKLATKIGSGATPTGGEKSYKRNGTSLIRSLNVHDRTFKFDDLAFLDDAQARKLDNVIVQSGDVLLNITGASVARCCLVPDSVLPARVNQHVSIIRPIQTVIMSRFLEFGLTAKINKDRLLEVGESAGATRQAITKAQIQDFTISYPPLSEQQHVVGRLDSLATQTDKLAAHQERKLQSLAELRQSILQKAFSGKLTSPLSQAVNEAAE